jgi:hypothetical protein
MYKILNEDELELSEEIKIEEKPDPIPPTTTPTPTPTPKKGPLDGLNLKGGQSLPGIQNISAMNFKNNDIAGELSSLNAEMERIIKKRDDLGMPKGNNKIKNERYKLKRKIDNIKKKIDKLKLKNISQEPLTQLSQESREKFKNLAETVKYKPRAPILTLPQHIFITEKLNILSKADKYYDNSAKVIAMMIHRFSHVTDNNRILDGYSADIKQSLPLIQQKVKECLIYQGMEGIDVTSSLTNPYIGLGIVLSLPLVTRYIYNKSIISKHKIDPSNLKSEQNPKTEKKKQI